ncbi:flagellar biosynthesis protein FlhB [Alteromonas pelagimontana]|uniref:Flagellar biosynthetic protein FlhB n=1 Tax=Alteromonas pelagimontana TaxID=1858656 RepID=A0A6M4MEX3_9ALTE|nr:EscU/YscU/HrcU family type III secretion system export apparatus switch protein [Alteromonas pelagimontana]QJR81731.1 flagellar biosynthesis protein FlhB [Alteromonas pelagimontana]
MKSKIRRAIGLKYNSEQGDKVPTVVAKGYGEFAEAIIEAAEEAGVLVHEDPYLSEILATLDVGQEIPESLYYVIAELIAYSYVLQGRVPKGWEHSLPGFDQLV